MTLHSDEPEHLFDPAASADDEIAALERALSPLAHRGTPPVWPERPAPRASSRRRTALRWTLPLAALLVAAAGVALFVSLRAGWRIETLAGTPTIDGRPVRGAARLRPGDRLETGDDGSARLAISWLGSVEVEPGSSLRLVSARERDQRLALERGTLHARISAPPRWFTVETASATAFDLGCAYTISIDRAGDGAIEVVSGWVALAGRGRESFVPRGARARLSGEHGPGTPIYFDAPNELVAAIDRLDGGVADTSALDVALDAARPRDAMTVWHLLARADDRDLRERIAARLDQLAPAREEIDREALLAGDRDALDRRWSSLGLGSAEFWRIWRQPWPPPGG